MQVLGGANVMRDSLTERRLWSAGVTAAEGRQAAGAGAAAPRPGGQV